MIFGTRQEERQVAARRAEPAPIDAGVAPDDLEQPMATATPEPELTRQPMRGAREQPDLPPLPREQSRASQPDGADDTLAPLFTPETAQDFRASWDAVQISFVDDPRQAVRQADQLVQQMLQDLAHTFSDERSGLDDSSDGVADTDSTERLRLALRRYRAFMQRLLSL